MRRLSINEFAYPVPVVTGVGAKNTISNGPDDGTNNLLSSHFWNPSRHGTTQQAVSNGLSLLVIAAGSSTGELNVGGHGNEGLLETGMGQTGPFDQAKIILTWNESSWGPEFDRLKPSSTTQVSIWSCHTGAGQDGADLLFAMAKRSGRAVRAGTGFLYSNNQSTWWENGSVWQVATPTNKPAPIPAPSPHSLLAAMVKFDIGGTEFEPGDVERFEVIPQFIGQRVAASKAVVGALAKDVVADLFAYPALSLDQVRIAGMITATIRLTFAAKHEIVMTVYNDRLAVDEATGTGYYVKPLLRKLYDAII